MRKSEFFQLLVIILVLSNVGIADLLAHFSIYPTGQEFIDLVSADALILLVSLTVFPIEKGPDMIIKNDVYYRTITIKHPHPQGEFKIRIFAVGVWNKRGLFTKVAKDVKPSLHLTASDGSRNRYLLAWLYTIADEFNLDYAIDSSDPLAIVQALKETVFRKRKQDFDPNDAWRAIVAFGLSTTNLMYAATEHPFPLESYAEENKGGTQQIRIPILFGISSPTLSVPPKLKQFFIVGQSWENALMRPVRRTIRRRVEGGYLTGFEIGES